MKAIATKQFINKYSKALVKEGTVVEVTEKRFKEINEAGFGELLVKEKDTKELDENDKDKDKTEEPGGKEK